MGKCTAMGEAHPAISAYRWVLLARGTYFTWDSRRCWYIRTPYTLGCLHSHDSWAYGYRWYCMSEDFFREIRMSRYDLYIWADDVEWLGSSDMYFASSWTRFYGMIRCSVPESRGESCASMVYFLVTLYAFYRGSYIFPFGWQVTHHTTEDEWIYRSYTSHLWQRK